jgi:hypothetical protein
MGKLWIGNINEDGIPRLKLKKSRKRCFGTCAPDGEGKQRTFENHGWFHLCLADEMSFAANASGAF